MASEITVQPAPDSTVAAVVAPPERGDEIFLEGPRSRLAEFCTLLRVMRDFLRGYRALHFVGPCVTVFGSARIKPQDPHYELALKMGAAIARLGFTVMTGGGPGNCHSNKYPTGISIVVSGCIIFSFAKRCW
jgi:hypothetical protein